MKKEELVETFNVNLLMLKAKILNMKADNSQQADRIRNIMFSYENLERDFINLYKQLLLDEDNEIDLGGLK